MEVQYCRSDYKIVKGDLAIEGNVDGTPKVVIDPAEGETHIKPDPPFDGMSEVVVVVTPSQAEKAVNITSNGSVVILPDQGFATMKKVVANVAIPDMGRIDPAPESVTIQPDGTGETTVRPTPPYDGMSEVVITYPPSQENKTVNITTNGQTVVVPDSEFTTMKKVTIESNVPVGGNIDKDPQRVVVDGDTDQDEIVITPDPPYDGFSEVVVVLPPVQDVKRINVTQNQTLSITPDSAYKSMKEVIAQINVITEDHPNVQPSKIVTYQSNGKRTVIPDASYTSMREVEVNIDVPEPGLQETKTVSLNSNGQKEIVPDEDYDGVKKVVVNVDVPVEDAQAEKVVVFATPGTKEIVPDEGYSSMQKVTVDFTIDPSIVPDAGENVKLQPLRTLYIEKNGVTTIDPDGDFDAMKQVVVATALPEPSAQTNKSINVTKNGEVIVNPDDTYTSMKKVTINAAFPEPAAQTSKSVSISKSGETVIYPDEDYTSMQKVVATVTVPESNAQQYKNVSVTQNGQQTITADDPYTSVQNVVLNVNVPAPSVQEERYVYIDSVQNYEIEPEEQYGSMKKVIANVNIPEKKIQAIKSIDVLNNGTVNITPDPGYDGLAGAQVVVQTQQFDGVSVQDTKEFTAPRQGTMVITPDAPYEAMRKVNANFVFGGIETDHPDVNITSNGTTNITPTAGKSGMDHVNVIVNVPQTTANLQEVKEVEVTSNNATVDVTPDSNYEGMKKVTVNVDFVAPSVQDSKTVNITREGSVTVQPDEGYDAISEVSVNVDIPAANVESTTFKTVTQNGSVEVYPSEGFTSTKKLSLSVNVPGARLQTTKQVTIGVDDNTKVVEPDENYDGLQSVVVTNTSKVVTETTKNVDLTSLENDLDIEVTPMEGYEAMKKAVVHVDIDKTNFIQDRKVITINSVDPKVITADEGYEAMKEVGIVIGGTELSWTADSFPYSKPITSAIPVRVNVTPSTNVPACLIDLSSYGAPYYLTDQTKLSKLPSGRSYIHYYPDSYTTSTHKDLNFNYFTPELIFESNQHIVDFEQEEEQLTVEGDYTYTLLNMPQSGLTTTRLPKKLKIHVENPSPPPQTPEEIIIDVDAFQNTITYETPKLVSSIRYGIPTSNIDTNPRPINFSGPTGSYVGGWNLSVPCRRFRLPVKTIEHTMTNQTETFEIPEYSVTMTLNGPSPSPVGIRVMRWGQVVNTALTQTVTVNPAYTTATVEVNDDRYLVPISLGEKFVCYPKTINITTNKKGTTSHEIIRGLTVNINNTQDDRRYLQIYEMSPATYVYSVYVKTPNNVGKYTTSYHSGGWWEFFWIVDMVSGDVFRTQFQASIYPTKTITHDRPFILMTWVKNTNVDSNKYQKFTNKRTGRYIEKHMTRKEAGDDESVNKPSFARLPKITDGFGNRGIDWYSDDFSAAEIIMPLGTKPSNFDFYRF